MGTGLSFPNQLRQHLQRRVFPWWIVTFLGVLTPVVYLVAAAAHEQSPSDDWGPEFAGMLTAYYWWVGVGAVAGVVAVTELFWQRVAIARSLFALAALAYGVTFILLMDVSDIHIVIILTVVTPFSNVMDWLVEQWWIPAALFVTWWVYSRRQTIWQWLERTTPRV